MKHKRLILFSLVLAMMITCISCIKDDGGGKKARYEGPFSEVNGSYAGIDALGRVLPESNEAPATREDRYVGLFYFLWQGQHGLSGPHDNNKIVLENPNAINSEKEWIASGGGALHAHHFWGEPLFGYYTSDDEWVMHKHVQMLTDAGVDFLTFDTTNAVTYTNQALKLLKILDFYYQQGWDVPKVSFYTNSSSGVTMNAIYQDIYKKHPEYEHLWFYWDGKPMIVGDENDSKLNDKVKEFFRIKANQWPNDPVIKDDGFPWMEFGRSLTEDAIYGLDGRKEVMNVSIAQHNVTVTMSTAAWYGGKDRTRSFHDGENDTSKDAILYGYNFAEQWEFAIEHDPEMIFVTGWNEWVAQRQPARSGQAIVFVDCADPNTSRDAEPMQGLFGDNYYMQMMYYIRLYKGVAPRVNVGDDITIDINGDFSQWNSATAVYKDYTGETIDRNTKGFGTGKTRTSYEDETGRNDIDTMKVVQDKENIYFYVKTVEDLTASSDPNWMNLFINIDSKNPNWEGYNFVINRKAPSDKEAVVEKSKGGWSWEEVGKAEMSYKGKELMVKIPKSLLDIDTNDLVDIRFKWVDNYQLSEDGSGDIFSFYQNGDAAPYGRLNYVFSEKK